MKIVLDAGHGYDTPGKSNPTGVKEYEINRKIVTYIKDILLTFQNVSVIFSHSDRFDVPLKIRVNQANKSNADLFLSIHVNAEGNRTTWHSANGIETFIHPTADQQTINLANTIQQNLIMTTDLKNRGVTESDSFLLRETSMPSLLITCGFITNKKEAEYLLSRTYQKACAEVIAKAIADEFDLGHKSDKPSQLTAPGIYRVQVGAFEDKKSAKELASNLRKLGYDPLFIFEKQ